MQGRHVADRQEHGTMTAKLSTLLAWQGSPHMLGAGNVVDQLRMQGPGAQRAPQRGCKRLLRRRPDDKQVWYLTITQLLSD